MPECSLPRYRGPERVMAGRFAVENQLNFSTPRLGIHRSPVNLPKRSLAVRTLRAQANIVRCLRPTLEC